MFVYSYALREMRVDGLEPAEAVTATTLFMAAKGIDLGPIQFAAGMVSLLTSLNNILYVYEPNSPLEPLGGYELTLNFRNIVNSYCFDRPPNKANQLFYSRLSVTFTTGMRLDLYKPIAQVSGLFCYGNKPIATLLKTHETNR